MAHLLVVDDEKRLAITLQLVLQGAGHSVRVAHTGEDALRMVTSDPPDLVLLDMKLPKLSGHDVLATIRRDFPAVQVVCMTAFATVASVVESWHAGALDYLEKPLDHVHLVAVVAAALSARATAEAGKKGISVAAEVTSPTSSRRTCSLIRDHEKVANLLHFLSRPTSISAGRDATPLRAIKADLLRILIRATIDPFALGIPVFVACAQSLLGLSAADSSDLKSQHQSTYQRVRLAAELSDSVSRTAMEIVRALQLQTPQTPSLRIEDFARSVSLHDTYVSDLLQAETGLRFRQWKWAILLAPSIRDIVTGTEQFAQIAFRCGYRHPEQLNRDFDQLFGMSPKQFRALPSATSCK